MKIIALLLSLVFTFTAAPAIAAPSYAAVKREAENLKKAERKLAKRIARLSEADRMRIKSKFSGTDSDQDGVADIIEGALGSNRCDSDSDDDGFNDSEDYREDEPGTDDDMPDDSPDNGDDSNSGGNPPPKAPNPPAPVEFEAKGTIASFTDPVLVVKGTSYTIGSGTQFVGTGFDREDLTAGTCVEVKGLRDGDQRLVTRIKRDNDC
jgi:hypothetical protein